jgi:hypothetical protein
MVLLGSAGEYFIINFLELQFKTEQASEHLLNKIVYTGSLLDKKPAKKLLCAY